ncbi:UNVERIFIED_CONTAM: hypothetical protein NCL1_35372 [Trichonephila clavipes]
MESLAPKMPNREQDLRHQGASSTGSLITAENPSLTRTVRNRLSQAFGLFTDPGPPPPLPPLCVSLSFDLFIFFNFLLSMAQFLSSLQERILSVHENVEASWKQPY